MKILKKIGWKLDDAVDAFENNYTVATRHNVMFFVSFAFYGLLSALLGIFFLYAKILIVTLLLTIITYHIVMRYSDYLTSRQNDSDSLFHKEPISSFIDWVDEDWTFSHFKRLQLPWKAELLYDAPCTMILSIASILSIPLCALDVYLGKVKKEVEEELEK